MEILFRGFHKQAAGPTIVININGVAERGRWVYGYYVGPVGILDTHEIADINDVSGAMYDVEPSTVGAYTGLTDKNGKKIFQGDMIDAPNRNFKGFPAEVRYMPNAAFMVRRNGYVPISLEDAQDFLAVVGTIYDSKPEGGANV